LNFHAGWFLPCLEHIHHLLVNLIKVIRRGKIGIVKCFYKVRICISQRDYTEKELEKEKKG